MSTHNICFYGEMENIIQELPADTAGLNGSVRCMYNSYWVWQHSFKDIDHEIFFTVILSLLLIQEEQLSVSSKRLCRGTGQPLRGQSMPGKVVR